MNTLIAKKVGMTQIFDENSAALGVTVLDVSDCRIVQVKSEEKDGYDAVQLTIGTAKNVNKPISEHYKKYNVEPGQGLYEVPTDPDSGLESGMRINVIDFFEIGQKVDITGIMNTYTERERERERERYVSLFFMGDDDNDIELGTPLSLSLSLSLSLFMYIYISLSLSL